MPEYLINQLLNNEPQSVNRYKKGTDNMSQHCAHLTCEH